MAHEDMCVLSETLALCIADVSSEVRRLQDLMNHAQDIKAQVHAHKGKLHPCRNLISRRLEDGSGLDWMIYHCFS